jgi:hypothetical protein
MSKKQLAAPNYGYLLLPDDIPVVAMNALLNLFCTSERQFDSRIYAELDYMRTD